MVEVEEFWKEVSERTTSPEQLQKRMKFRSGGIRVEVASRSSKQLQYPTVIEHPTPGYAVKDTFSISHAPSFASCLQPLLYTI